MLAHNSFTFKLLGVLAWFLVTSFQGNSQKDFESFLGAEKAQVIEQGMEHFENFLKLNYPGCNDAKRVSQFLQAIDTPGDSLPNWSVHVESSLKLMESYENSGLRKDAELFGYEEYDSVFIYDIESKEEWVLDSLPVLTLELEEEPMVLLGDSTSIAEHDELLQRIEHESEERWKASFHRNLRGRYHFLLMKFFADDPIVVDFTQAFEVQPNLSTAIIAGGLDEAVGESGEYSEGVQLIILFELYMPYLRWHLTRIENR